MEANNSSQHLQTQTVSKECTLKISNNAHLGNISTTETQIVPDTSVSSNSATTVDSAPRSIHIPYILNGELFEIQTQDGENVTVKCCNCPPDRVYRGSVRSTGNFHMHIKRRHPDLMGRIYDMKVNALVERRDRFLKNRKSSRRRSTNAIGRKQEPSRGGQRLACASQPSLELFKIKAAFQRHQLQQQQQNQNQQNQNQLKSVHSPDNMHKWNIIDHFLASPGFERAHNNTIMDAYNEQPLNYSLKECTSEGAVFNTNYAERGSEFGIKEANTTINSYLNEMPATMVADEQVTGYESLTSQKNNHFISAKQQSLPQLTPIALTQQYNDATLHPSNSDQSLFGRATTVSAVTPCPSDVSSNDASQGANSRPYDVNSNNLGFIKNELLLAEIQPIDLSTHATPTGFSESSGFISTVDAKQASKRETSTFNLSERNIKCNEILLEVVNALQNVHRELQSHNQTNKNWLNLEIAKFKFLHPEFQFQY